MSRRHLILAAALAVVALGAAWWMSWDGLTAQSGGWWGGGGTRTQQQDSTTVFSADRRYRSEGGPPQPIGEQPPVWWSIQGDWLVFDAEPSPLRRALRPVARFVRLRIGPVMSYQMEQSADELVFPQADGSRVICVRISD